MYRRTALVLSFCLCAALLSLQAQEFKLFDRQVQIHGFASQGFVHTGDNNWLTMNTSNVGSGEFTDFGANASVQITDKFRVGSRSAWTLASVPRLGIRRLPVQALVRHSRRQSQDCDWTLQRHPGPRFPAPFALLPQSIYPTDLRDSTIAHIGGDVYGTIPLGKRLGTISYTGYAGQRQDSQYGGYPYLLEGPPALINFSSYGGLQYGADLRWTTPLKGLLVGLSRMNEDIDGYGTTTAFGPLTPYHEWSKADWTNQYYGQYTRNKLQIDSEYRRYWRDQEIYSGLFGVQTNVRGWYVAGAYRVAKRLQLGSYYSRYWLYVPPEFGPGSEQSGHIYDKVITGRIDLNRFMNVKVEGHFMDGYGVPGYYPDGFYNVDNPQGLKPNTNALVVRTGFNF